MQNAWDYRKKTVDTSSCRIIFGEADFLPGLVVDKFSDVLVVQSLALGIDRMKEEILSLLVEALRADGVEIRGIYERSDAKVREQEGLPRQKGFIGAEFPTRVQIVENGVRYEVDVEDGQKTGFFLDQKYNRLAIQRLCRDARVLDCFTHTGSFALNAGIAGASSVLGVDASQLAVDQARINAELNGLSDRVQFQCADVFDLLPELERQGEQFDVVILDPPAFAKSRASVKNATRGYRDINLRGMKLVRDGGSYESGSGSTGGSSSSSDIDIDEFREEVIRLTNIEREKAGLDPLVEDSTAMEYAQIRAEELTVSFSHTRPNGESKIVDGMSFLENAARGQTTPEDVVDSWMNSEGHRAALLRDYSDYGNRMGTGCYVENGTIYWTQEFVLWDANA